MSRIGVAVTIVILAAAPFYWVAFIGGKMLWVLPGVAIVLLGRLLVRGTPRATLAYVDDTIGAASR